MNLLRLTAERSRVSAAAKRSRACATAKRSTGSAAATPLTRFVRPLVAALLAGLLAAGPVSPLFAQEPAQNPPAPAPGPAAGSATPSAPIPVSLGVSKYNYSHAPRPFPNLLNPYKPIHIAELGLSNSPRIDQLIHDGKLEIGLQDAVELALENSMDITVARYTPWFAETDILATESGSQPFGITGAAVRQSFANIPFLNLDPTITSSLAFDDRTQPVNNPFISGTGTTTSTAASLRSHTSQFNTGYSQGFATGTTMNVTWNNTRSSSSSAFNFFNPDVSSALTVSFSQQLLNGFGLFANRRNILIAKNNRKLADYVFEQQAITTVTSTITAYWELVYARENVKVQEQAVTVSNKLYGDNRKQLEIGTLAPLDVTRAEAQLATDRQNLIVAQTTKLTDEQVLKNAISKDPLATNLINVEIIPTDRPTIPGAIEAASFEEAIKEAFTKRPDLQEQEINVKNAAIDARATRLALLPTATLTAQYQSQGLAGNSPIITGTTTTAGTNIVGANGQPVTVLDNNNVPVEIFEPSTTATTAGINHQGLGTAQSQIFHNQFPDYLVFLNLQIPIRNRAAQATNQHAILAQRQIEAQRQQLKNVALLDVRNTYIALQQDRARVQAASKARELQQQTFDAEQKKYQLGASTVYQVILTQRDLISSQGAELRALADLVEAKANYERAVGRTLEVNRVTIADAKHGAIERDTLIPGTLNGEVVGVEKIFANSGQR